MCRALTSVSRHETRNPRYELFKGLLYFAKRNFSYYTHVWECKSVRSKQLSIDGRFDRQKSIRSKTSISSIKVWISSPPTLNLSSTKVSGQVDVFSLPNVRSEHTPLEKLIFFSRCMDKWKVNISLARSIENHVSASRTYITSRNHYTTQELLLLSIRLQSCSFYNHLLFDRTDSWFRSKRPSIETTLDRNDLLPYYLSGCLDYCVITCDFSHHHSCCSFRALEILLAHRSRLYSGHGAFSIIYCFYEYSRFEEKIYFLCKIYRNNYWSWKVKERLWMCDDV